MFEAVEGFFAGPGEADAREAWTRCQTAAAKALFVMDVVNEAYQNSGGELVLDTDVVRAVLDREEA